jgi:serine/threonine-protein kinase RsbT
LGLSSIIKQSYDIPANDLSAAGEASSSVKKMLNQLGIPPQLTKKVSIAMYEAEINAVIHACGGTAEVEIDRQKVIVRIQDVGPGIPDIDLAMKEGYSTAPDSVREMGFGAGMGLPNMKRYADNLEIKTEVGVGTCIIITVFIR